MPYRILWIIIAAALSLTVASAQASPRIVVTWVAEGDLWVWQQGGTSPTKLVEGDVTFLSIAPDGKHIAFTRGDVTQPADLWVVELITGNLIELTRAASPPDAIPPIDQLEWLDSHTLYFNTRQSSGPFLQRQDDLWRADVLTGEVRQLLTAGQGGYFVFSPNHQRIALVRPGVYDGQEGTITLVDPSARIFRELLSFPAVSTGSEYAFYPLPQWNDDSSALSVSIPPRDLIYNDSSAATTIIWQLNVDGPPAQLAHVQASFFGLPQLSSSGQYLTYIRRKGDLNSNQLELIVAASSGSNPSIYAAGSAGTIGGAHWLPDSDQFFFVQGNIGDYWLGSPDHPPQRLPDQIVYPLFVDDTTYVYATYPGNPYELRYAYVGAAASHLIATFTNLSPVMDAVLIP